MSEAANLETVKRGYEVFGRGDLDGLLALFDENIDWITPGPPDLPTSGHRRGRKEVGAFFQTLLGTFDFERFEPREFLAQGDRVVVIGDDTIRVKSTGGRVDFGWVHVFQLRNGLVTAFREYGDVSAIVAEVRSAQVASR